MSDFDTEDLKLGKPVSNDFAPEDMQKAVSAGPVSDFADQDLQQGIAVSPPERPMVSSQPVEASEIEGIAAKYKMDPQKLRGIAPYYGVNLAPGKADGAAEALEYGAKSAAGEIGSTVGFGVPQFAYKKLALEEQERQALDELRRLSDSRQSRLEGATQFARQIAVPAVGVPRALTAGKGALNAAGRLAEATAVGSAAGVASSYEGEEAKAAKQGAFFGAALGGAAEGLGKLLGPRVSPREVEAVRGRQTDIEQGIESIAGKTGDSEKVLEEITFGRKETLTPQESEKIVKEQLGDESLSEYLDPQSPKGEMIRHQIDGPATDANIIKRLSDDIIEARARDFAEDLTGKRPSTGEEALVAVQEHAARQGSEASANSYRNFVNLKQAERAIEESGAVAKNQPGFWGTVVNKLSDNQYVLRHLDDKYGINSEAILRELNKARNRLTFARSDTRTDLGKIHGQAVRNGSDKAIQETSRLYDALDTGDDAVLSQAEKQTADLFRQYFRKGREFSNDLVRQKDPNIAPLNIPEVENYVPHVSIPVQEQIPKVEARIREAEALLGGRKISELSARELTAASKVDGPLKDLIDFHKWSDNTASVSDGRTLIKDIEQKLHSREGNIALESRARAALERSGEIPDFILQKNLYKLADSWSHNTYNHLYLRNALEKLGNEARKLKKLGAEVESDYISRIAQDSLGIRKGTAAEGFLQSKIGAHRKLDSLIDQHGKSSPTGVALTAVKYTPEVLYGLMRNIYPNLLGYGNMYAATQNLVTGFTRLAPELGTRYGYATVLRGTVKALLNFREYYKLAEQMGNVPSDVLRKGEAALAEGLFRSKAFNLPKEGYQKLAQFGMKLFEGSEKLNRAMTIGVADMMAADIARGSPAAMGSLRRFPLSVQKVIMRNPNNAEANSRILAQYLNDTTQFNYNRSSLFEYGRTLGPVLSTFSKWPTAVLGETAYTFRNKGFTQGSLRNMERLLLPFLMLQAVDYSMGERDDDPTAMSDRMKKFVGTHGLSAMSPMNALHGFVSGEIFTPPAVDLIMKGLVIPTFSGDTEKLGKGLDTALRNYAPGSGLLRLITDDMVTHITGRRPEGSTFIERTEEGARQLEK